MMSYDLQRQHTIFHQFYYIMADIALCDLAAALNPTTHGRSGWNCYGYTPTASICTGSISNWGGVLCISDYVKSVSLAGLGLVGTIPDSVGYLSRLQSLVLSSNAISGTIPTSFGLLSLISVLKVDSNSLTGSVPSALCAAKSLNTVSFSANLLGCYASCLTSVSTRQYGTTARCNDVALLSNRTTSPPTFVPSATPPTSTPPSSPPFWTTAAGVGTAVVIGIISCLCICLAMYRFRCRAINFFDPAFFNINAENGDGLRAPPPPRR